MLANLKSIAAVCLVAIVGIGCADQRAHRPDDQAMLIYRDCMNGTPREWEASASTAALSDPGTRQTASFDAAVDSKRQEQAEIECARIAGWQ